MLDLKFIRDNINVVKTAARNKNCSVGFDHLIKLDKERRELIQRVEEVKVKRGLHGENADNLRIKTKVLHSINPAVTITDYALAKNIDLIVLNTYSRSGIKKLVLGSTTENIIQSSHCSTLVIRP